MKKYAFFGGSFNPPTIAHKTCAETILQDFELDKLFFVPVGDRYKKDGLINEKYRYEMLKLICKENQKLDVCDIELNTNINYKAIDVFRLIKNKYKNDEIYFIMGADNFENILNWKEYRELISNYRFILLNRNKINLEKLICQNEILNKYRNNFYCINNMKEIEISSTFIRNKIKIGEIELIKDMLDVNVLQYIEKNELYK
ncbi:MAG: nicotinate (nicotinamide) nucleotide adenylyltransferase [Clostridia bacterium]|nr:nicotinate (nicotinamide) nucleotide adenylyltransferase [Clostridia bacterium]